MKRTLAFLLSAVVLFSLAGCQKKEPDTLGETTPTTVPVAEELEHYDLNETDLAGIGELLAKRDMESLSRIRLDGLCTPVILELKGTDVVTVSAYGTTVCVAQEAKEFSSIYGNLWPVIYDHEGLIFLNIWHDDIGYSCVLCPNGTFIETYPDKEWSSMIYLDEENRMVQSRFARKFLGIEQWDTGPIDTACSREDPYYSIDDAHWTGEELTTTQREFYTISDCFDLDGIFADAKANGLYPDFDTLDALLAHNGQRDQEPENGSDEGENTGPDSVRDETGWFDQTFAARDYEKQNLVCETFYDRFGEEYFTKTHTYDAKDRDISGSWCFQGEEVYRYTNTYNDHDLVTETVWYREDQEVERFTYTYYGDGSYTKTYTQDGEKKYTYTFDEAGELSAHSTYENGKEIKTEDVSALVKTQQLTDIWFPVIDNEALHYSHHYNGTVPGEDLSQWNVTPSADGGQILIRGEVDSEDGSYYATEQHYDSKGRLRKTVYLQDSREYSREEYEYVGSICVREIGYEYGVKAYTCEKEYNKDSQLVRTETTYVNQESYYIYTDENGDDVNREVTYTKQTETFHYDDRGLLVESVLCLDGEEFDRTAYRYDVNGNVLPQRETCQYFYNVEGIPTGIWLIYETEAAGAALLRTHTVYVTRENANQLQQIMRDELFWI